MSLLPTIEKFVDQSPLSLIASGGGPLSVKEIHNFYECEVLPEEVNKKYGPLCLAGLLMAQDYIWEAHDIVQERPDLEASWWHAFVHRMEGDYANSAYWYRRVSSKELYSQLFQQVNALSLDPEVSSIQRLPEWDPLAFNKLISKYKNQSQDSLQAVHKTEFKFLLSHCMASLTTP